MIGSKGSRATASRSKVAVRLTVAAGTALVGWLVAGWLTPLANERLWFALPIAWLMWHLLEGNTSEFRGRSTLAAIVALAAVGLAWYLHATFASGLGRQVIGREVAITAYFFLALAVACSVVLVIADRLVGLAGRLANRVVSRYASPQSVANAADRHAARAGTKVSQARAKAYKLCKALVSLLLILPIFVEALQLHPIRTAPLESSRHLRQGIAKPFTVVTTDGLKVSAALIPAVGGLSEATAIICHGLADSKESMLGLAGVATSAGYNAIVLDLRAHGESTGHTTTFGILERRDVLAVCDAAKEKWPKAFETTVGCGWSMGAAALLHAQAEAELFDGLWLDCPYAWTADMAWEIARNFPPGLSQWVWTAGLTLSSIETGVNFFQAGPASLVDRLRQVPTIVVHGTADEVIPYDQGTKLFELLKEPKRFVRAEGAGHCGSWPVLAGQYEQAFAALLQEVRTNRKSRAQTNESAIR